MILALTWMQTVFDIEYMYWLSVISTMELNIMKQLFKGFTWYLMLKIDFPKFWIYS